MAVGVSGANKTDHHVRNVVPGRDFPLEGDTITVTDLRNAVEGDTLNGQPLKFRRGIEVGQVFKLGTKYSQKLGATFLDEDGVEQVCLMGCYGIGINRIFASAIETGNDDRGCILPINIAPFEVHLVQIGDAYTVSAESERIHDELSGAGIEVLLDDRSARPGVKFADADLIGIPVRVVVGDRGLKEGVVELRKRCDADAAKVPTGDAVAETRKIVEALKQL